MDDIRKEIVSNLKKTVASQLPPSINKALAKQQGESEIYKGMELDWSLPTKPIVTPSSLEFGIKGLFFPKDQGEIEPVEQPPAMPYHDNASPAKF